MYTKKIPLKMNIFGKESKIFYDLISNTKIFTIFESEKYIVTHFVI